MSIFDLSESAANTMHNISNIIVLFGSIAAVAGTVGLFWTGGVKNKYEKVNELKTQERITVANKVAAEANERAAKANLAAEKLKAKLAWRNLTSEQQHIIAERMSNWSVLPKSKDEQSIAVFSTNGNFESTRLANQIAEALGPNGAGCAINRYPVTYGMSFSVSGIAILTSPDTRGLKVASALVETLKEVGLSASIAPKRRQGSSRGSDERFDSAISVMVGDHL
jgi:hypothetical protein